METVRVFIVNLGYYNQARPQVNGSPHRYTLMPLPNSWN